ncbi:MAG: Glu/Leu/Phe/Val dehydrogenase [Gammaproteobacteria bacterium]
MSVFDHPEFDQHESIHHFCDPETGLQAIIAVHSTALGPAAGGCRRWRYASDADALTDALRLSRGMTYKNAVAGLPFGGGKAVILAGEGAPKSPALFAAFGRAVASLEGRYITAEDVGISVEDMRSVRAETAYVSGLPQTGESAGGDPSPSTALGVFLGIGAAVERRLGRDSLEGVRVAVQGVGHVGWHLCRLLHEAGAILSVADVVRRNAQRAAEELDATVLPVSEILAADADVLAPCALGNILTSASIPKLRVSVVAGGANNQLTTAADGARLSERGILYAPDYVINAGGIISVAREYLGGSSEDQVRAEVGRIPERLRAIFEEAERTGRPTNEVADELARRIVAGGSSDLGAGPSMSDGSRAAGQLVS